MGKPIISQKRGKGSPTYRVPNSGKKYKPEYARNNSGRVLDILHDKGRNSPVAKIQYDDGIKYAIAPLGLRVGASSENIGIPISQVPESSTVFAIETSPFSGPQLCMTPGSVAIVVSKTDRECVIKLPSKKQKALHPNCRVTIGLPAGEGRQEKPFTKAGDKYYLMKARGRLWPRSSAKAMNAVSHPFGSGYGGGVGRPKTTSRNAPPGAKVGSIASKRTGRKKF